MPWLSLFLLLIMCAVIFFQTIHGLFSALIMAVICVLAGTLALGLHEMIAEQILAEYIGDYAYPVSYVGVFGIVVVLLRVTMDKLVPRDTLLPSFINKAGSVFFGVITGFVTVGVLGTGIQMLPLGPEILGFERLNAQGEPNDNLILNPDAFAVSLCGYLADHTLTADGGWRQIHPDFLTELHWLRNTESAGSRLSVNAGSVRATGLWETKRIYKFTRATTSRTGSATGRRSGGEFETIDGPPAGRRWLVVGLQVNDGGADNGGQFRFSSTQVRLVGESGQGMIQQFTPKAIGSFQGIHVTADSQSLWTVPGGKFEFVFEVAGDFKHRFIEFKRSGRSEVQHLKVAASTGSQPETVASAAAAAPARSARARRGSGVKTVPLRPQEKDSHFGNSMPMSIKRYAGSFLEFGGDQGSLRSGQLALYVDNQESDGGSGSQDPEQNPLNSFSVPSGSHLLQLNMEAVHAKSALAEALNMTRRALRQYRVIDQKGRDYWPAGLIAECDSGGRRVMEIQFFPENAEIRSQIRSFQRMRFSELTGDYRFVLLFLLPPGAEVVTFDPGGRPVDISDMKLVAPG